VQVTLPGVLQSERLRLVRWRHEYLDALMVAIEMSLAELGLWLPWAQEMPTAEAERIVIEQGSRLLFEVDSDELVGGAGLHPRRHDSAEIGYWVRSDRHRRGYATEAAKTLVDAGFNYLPDLQVIEIHMDRANLASAGVPKRLVFKLLGEVERDQVTPGHSGRGLIWMTDRGTWARRD
jgi:RimJ/RimL family protein N-acetyltransferase